MINFNFSPSSLEYKMELIEMIDQMKVNDKVGIIVITLFDDNIISDELVE